MERNTLHKLLIMALVAAMLLTGTAPAAAQSEPGPAYGQRSPLSMVADAGVLYLDWHADTVQAAALDALPTVRFGGYDLPMRLVTVTGDAAHGLVVDEVRAETWNGELTPAATLVPPALGFAEDPFMLQPDEPHVLPSAPVFVYSKGRVRGQDVQVIAISPIFAEDGTLKVVRSLRARVAGVTPVDDVGALAESAVQAAGLTARIGANDNLTPSNSAASVTGAVKITARNAGIQSISGKLLNDLGFDTSKVAKLRLVSRGAVIPLEVLDNNKNGTLEAGDSIRFFAPVVGDYWNSAEVYWLSNEGNGTFMERRAVAPAGAPLRTSAIEKGVWKDNKKYVSQQAGPDGDHWYAADLKVDPGMQGQASSYPKVTAFLNLHLPVAAGEPALFTPQLNTYIKGEYELRLKAGNKQQSVFLDTATTAGTATIWQPEISVNGTAAAVDMTLIPGDTIAGLLIDGLAWRQPVSLQFGGQGATFSGVDGTWRYQLLATAANVALYDITMPQQPQRLTGLDGSQIFQDGPEAHDYLVTGPGTLHTPVVEMHKPIAFSRSGAADALYITPGIFVEALQPLVDFRKSQGYRVQVIDVQEIYDAWSYGQVDPAAIRAFLRFAVDNWNPAPISAVLVGDGTRDPFNYEERDTFVNFIPPYLLTSYTDTNGFERFVDPWLGQNGCDNCYAQLDGADPLNNEFETPGRGFLPDIWLGRFPVKSSAEVKAVVSKIIRYETTADASPYWRHTAAFLADDYIRPDGSPDSAGDFVKYSEDAIDLLPGGMHAARLYYDPHHSGNSPWREPDAVAVRQRAIALANRGPALLTYNGHANHWQWAGTALGVENPYIFGLYDVDLLNNQNQLFINLSMTCYTSQFFQPANSGTTLDERMFLHPSGGAAAVWGPAGLSVLHGHDDLQYGFHKRLWTMAPGTARMGELTTAGYMENFAPSSERGKAYACCEDVRRTFVLFGDPLMTVQATPNQGIYLPLVTNR